MYKCHLAIIYLKSEKLFSAKAFSEKLTHWRDEKLDAFLN